MRDEVTSKRKPRSGCGDFSLRFGTRHACFPGLKALLTMAGHIGGMANMDTLKASEIADIDGQNLPDAMDIHACCQSGVMDLYALNVM
jgi:hypothetical protein